MIFRYLKPHTTFVVLTTAMLLGQVVTDLLLPGYMAQIVDEGIAQNDTSVIFRYGLRMLSVALAGIVCVVSKSVL